MTLKRYEETLHEGWGQRFEVEELLFRLQTEHQDLVVFENPVYGRVMALDGVIQTTEADEFIYHEMLTHVPLLAHGHARTVLIIGGGDGGMLREVLKHREIERVVQVEIDRKVIEMCVEYLPNHSQGAYDDQRAEVVISDGKDYVLGSSERFDLIISDCTDPIGPGETLFESDFYRGCKRCLKEGGVFVAQNGVSFTQPEEVATTYRRISPFFADRHFYTAVIPTYVGGAMAFAWATDNRALRQVSLETLNERFKASAIKTRYYNPAVHLGAFALPQYLLDLLATAAPA